MNQETYFERWLRLPSLTPEDRQQLYHLAENPEAFARAFSEPLQFGTAGLRGIMGEGPAQLNHTTISWASAGVAYWLEVQGITEGHIILCGDNRQLSGRFVQTAARTLAAYGHKATIWLAPTPVPLLSWAVRKFGASAGIAITASHNPKEYNGFKVYGPNGAQLLPEECRPISDRFAAHLEGLDVPPLKDLRSLYQSGRLKAVPKDADDHYLADLISGHGAFAPFTRLHSNSQPSLLYTPLHGTGATFVPEALRSAGFTQVKTVDSQMIQDGEFPTVSRPNPEDPGALEEALRIAYVTGPDLVIATDPDCDRMGCAVHDGGDYVYLTGNQIAALMIDFLAHYTPRHDGDTIITSVVSSPFAKQLALARGFALRETLTGFKYIGMMAEEMAADGSGRFFFGYEESGGYLAGNHARDKDGIFASLLIAAACRAQKNRGKTLIDRLNELYLEVGTWYDRNFSINLPSTGRANAAEQVMSALRQLPPHEVCGRPVWLTMDYLHGTLSLAPENMLQYHLPEGSIVTIRPSGTEPKMKCYVSACAQNHDHAQATAEALAHNLRQAVRRTKEPRNP